MLTIYKQFIGFIVAVLLITPIFAQDAVSNSEAALQKAGKNRASLEQVLKHYAKDKEKYQAACFLIENMHGHSQAGVIKYYDPQVDLFRNQIDSAYYAMVKGKSNEDINSQLFKQLLSTTDKIYRDKIEKYPFRQPEIVVNDMPDIQTLDAEFLIRQIDNAFYMRKHVKFARQLSFSDFCSYVLPYRVINDYPLVQNAKLFNDFFSKYVQAEKAENVNEAIERYNATASRLRWFMGKYPFETNIGFNELFFNSFFDCVDVAHYGASALRACGIPTSVEYNVAYKLWSNRHYHVSTLDSKGRWCTFSPEGGLPEYKNPKFEESLNIFRLHFDKQKYNPAALKAANEIIPNSLSDPYIEDVTANIMDVIKLQLPFKISSQNRLAYLASFQSQTGLIPVTWGSINVANKTVDFNNVVPDNLYFPVYFDKENRLVAFGDPFWLKKDKTKKCGYNMKTYVPKSDKIITVDLIRKFPRKPNMFRLAESLKGTIVIASNNPNFTDADTLYRITTTPDDCYQDLILNNTIAYRYYRVQSRKEYPHLHISEIEFLTNKKYNYSNVISPMSLPIISHKQSLREDSTIVRLLDEPLEKCKWKAEYDGNVQTATDAYPSITFKLHQPQVVTHIRFAPKNEDNRIQPGDMYSLSVWNGSEWQWLYNREAKYHHIAADGLEVGRMYWLHNCTKGTEELPFIIDEAGKQNFVHEELLRKLQL